MEITPSVLFVCATNSCRSQMAEGIMRDMEGDRLEVASAGVEAGRVHPLAIEVMAESGHDISSQRSKAIEDISLDRLDLVITLCEEARDTCLAPALAGSEARKRLLAGVPAILHWSVEDPIAGGDRPAIGAFRAARDEILRRLRDLVDGGCLDALVRERERMHRFADMLDSGIAICDEQRVFFLVNRAALEMTGLDRDRIIGRDCHEAFPPRGLCGAECQLAGDAARATGRREHTARTIDRDGRTRLLGLTTEPMEIEPGNRGMLAVIRDVTEIRDLERQLGKRRSFHGMIGASSAVQEVFETIRSVGSSDYSVLITGESGTGKELVAAAIHEESARRGGPLVPVNCGALPESILESELFGHVRGAFTGAIRDKKGRFELAHRGTLFLDEVADLPMAFQVKLLRVLQEGSFERVGGERRISVDVRVIAATNRDPKEMVRTGEFREDLFYRLCVVPIHLPPLRDRREDIPLLVEQIVERVRGETGKDISAVDNGAMDMLLAHGWPGNIRELINAMQFAAVRCPGDTILAEHLPPEVRAAAAAHRSLGEPRPASGRPPERGGRRLKLTREDVERALAETGGNKLEAARLLGVGRATLYRFFQKNPIR